MLLAVVGLPSCAGSRLPLEQGRFRVTVTPRVSPVNISLGESLQAMLLLGGVLPPDGSLIRLEIYYDGEFVGGEEGTFYPRSRSMGPIQCAFSKEFFREKASESGNAHDPNSLQPQEQEQEWGPGRRMGRRFLKDQVEVHVEFRMSLRESMEGGWRIAARTVAVVHLTCPDCELTAMERQWLIDQGPAKSALLTLPRPTDQPSSLQETTI